MDPHRPYEPPVGWASFGYTEEERYLGEIRYCDSEIGRLLDALHTLGRDRETLLVFVADHGEAFGEHGWQGHGRSLHAEEVRVPLILRYPSRLPASHRVRSLVRTIDLYPTIAELMGLELPRQVEGESLLPLLRTLSTVPGREAFSELPLLPAPGGEPSVSLEVGRYKLILRLKDGSSSLYDILGDPCEQRDLSVEEPTLAARLVRRLRRFLGMHRPPEVNTTSLSPLRAARLRSLGYLVPTQPRPTTSLSPASPRK